MSVRLNQFQRFRPLANLHTIDKRVRMKMILSPPFLPVYRSTATLRTSSRCDKLIELAIDVKAAIALEITAIRSEGWLSVGTRQSYNNTSAASKAYGYYSHAKVMWLA